MTPDPYAPTAEHPFNLPGYRPSDDEKNWALIAHVSAIVLGFIGPIIALAVKGNESKWVRAHAIEALNFHITLFIVYAFSGALTLVLVGFCTLFAAMLVSVILSILAGVKAFQGGAYRYPFALRLIKE